MASKAIHRRPELAAHYTEVGLHCDRLGWARLDFTLLGWAALDVSCLAWTKSLNGLDLTRLGRNVLD